MSRIFTRRRRLKLGSFVFDKVRRCLAKPGSIASCVQPCFLQGFQTKLKGLRELKLFVAYLPRKTKGPHCSLFCRLGPTRNLQRTRAFASVCTFTPTIADIQLIHPPPSVCRDVVQRSAGGQSVCAVETERLVQRQSERSRQHDAGSVPDSPNRRCHLYDVELLDTGEDYTAGTCILWELMREQRAYVWNFHLVLATEYRVATAKDVCAVLCQVPNVSSSQMRGSVPSTVFLQVVDSNLELRVDLGSDDRVLTLPVNVSDGLWHSAYMQRWGNQISLQLDGGDGR